MALDSIIPSWLRNRSPKPEVDSGPEVPAEEPVNGSAPAPDFDTPPPREGLLSAEAELRARREEIVRMEERALRDLESARTRMREADRRAEMAEERERRLEIAEQELEQVKSEQMSELESISGLTRKQAKELLLKQVEDEASHQAGLTVRRIEEEARLDAERRAASVGSAKERYLARKAAEAAKKKQRG